jgi:hypothetical protein
VVAPTEAEDRDRDEHERADRPPQCRLVDGQEQPRSDRHGDRGGDAQQGDAGAVGQPQRGRDERHGQRQLEEQRDRHRRRRAVQRRQQRRQDERRAEAREPAHGAGEEGGADRGGERRRQHVQARPARVDHAGRW